MSRSSKIKLIICDFYGVMTRGSYKETCRYLARRFGDPYEKVYDVVYHTYFTSAVMGKIPEKGFLGKAMKELGYPVSDAEILAKHLSFQKLNRSVFNLMKRYQARGIPVLILSKNTPQQFESLLKSMKIRCTFPHVINTYDHTLAKSDPKMMQIVYKKFSVTPQEAVMIDDQEFSFDAAKTFGTHCILYKKFPDFRRTFTRLIKRYG